MIRMVKVIRSTSQNWVKIGVITHRRRSRKMGGQGWHRGERDACVSESGLRMKSGRGDSVETGKEGWRKMPFCRMEFEPNYGLGI